MTSFALRFSAPDTVSSGEASSSFYWLDDPRRSSFRTALRPGLGTLGAVPALNIDLVRIAVAVFAADRSVTRAGRGSDWNARSFDLEVPVSEPDVWSAVALDLGAVVGFLTGDHWRFSFNLEPSAPEEIAAKTTSVKRVVLLSGGADSAVGAIVSRSDLRDGDAHAVVSHYSAPIIAPIQRDIAKRVDSLIPGPGQHHHQFHLLRNKKRLDGSEYPTEPSSRSRSLLFLAFGLAVASLDGVPLWIPENGFASLNPPLGPERRGSLSTRTTHPAFLGGLAGILVRVGAHGEIENPFADSTKGEMFKRAAALIGADDAGQLLGGTNSCAHTGQRAFGVSPATACGVCFGCVVRRAAFNASGIADTTTYIDPSGNDKLQAWLDDKSVEPAVRSFAARGVRQSDLIAMSLPTSFPLSRARDLCDRAITELTDVLA